LYSPAALARFFVTAAIGLGADLWTKSLAVSQLTNDRIVDAIPGWLQFQFVENPGAVFGIAPGQRVVFLVVSVAAVLFLTYLFSASNRRPFYQIILGLLLAGVLGNMYDRIEFGKVRDMIHMLPDWYWPHRVRHVLKFLPEQLFPYIFNVADTLLCTGVGLMLIYSFFNTTDPEKAKASTPANA
jgi:signal peptidase II